MSEYAGKIVIGAVLAVVLGIALLAGIAYLPLNNQTTNTTVNVSPLSCLFEVPINATIGTFQNSTMMGYMVTYANGSNTFFPAYSCPTPVHPDLFALTSTIEVNSQFVADENGTTIPVVPFIGGHSTEVNGSTFNYVDLNFILFSNEKLYPCGPNGYWVYKELAKIQVSIPVDARGNYMFSKMTMEALPQGMLNIFHCITTTNLTTTT